MVNKYLVGALLLLFVSISFAQSNSVDAVSSASGKIKVTGGSAYSDSAVLTTYHKYTYGTHWLEYGTSTSYGTDIYINNSPKDQDITITSLNENTKYYFKFNGDDPGERAYKVTGDFTTVTATSVLSNGLTLKSANSSLSVNMQGDDLLFSTQLSAGDNIAITTLQGKRVFTGFVTKGLGNSIKLSDISNGSYIVTLTQSGKIIGRCKLSVITK